MTAAVSAPEAAPPIDADAPEEAFDTEHAIQMVDASGTRVRVAHVDAPRAFLEGGFGFEAGSKIPMRAPNGEIGLVPAERAQQAFASGAAIATPEELHKAQIAHDYDNFAGYLEAGAAEAANQALLGTGDAIAVGAANAISKEAGARVKQTLSDLREENPISSGVGGVVGALAPVALTGGESIAARVLSAPTRALGEVGDVAAGLGRAILPEAETGAGLVSRIGRAAIEQGARGAAEGAVLNAGNELSEEMLGDPELNGEKLLAAMGHGALLGGAAGVLLAGTGELGREVLGRARPALNDAAAEQAFRALNPRQKLTELSEKLPGGVKGIGQELLDRDLLQVGDKVTDLAPRIAKARVAAGEEIGSLLSELDALGAKHAPKASSVIDRVRREVIEPLARLPGYKSEVRAVAGYLEDFAVKTQEGLTYTGLRDIRAALDDKIFRGSSALAPSPVMKELQKMRAIVEDELTQNGDKAARSIGKEFAEKYEAAKLSYRRLKVAEDISQKATAAITANRVLSPTDYLAGLAGFAGGGLHGGIAGIVGGALHHVVRERGNATAAVLLEKAAALGAVQKAARAVDAEVDRGIAGVLEPGKRAAVKVRPAAFGKASDPYREHANAVIGATTGADAHAAAIEAAASPIASHAPLVAKAFQRAALRTTMSLAQAIPRGHIAEPSLTPQFDKSAPSSLEKERFERQRAIAHDPIGVTFSRAAQGTLTRADVDVFRKNSPKLYDAVVARTQEQLANIKTPLPVEREQQLRVLMRMPPAPGKLSATMAKTWQEAAAAKPAPGPKATPKQRVGLANALRLPGGSEEGAD